MQISSPWRCRWSAGVRPSVCSLLLVCVLGIVGKFTWHKGSEVGLGERRGAKHIASRRARRLENDAIVMRPPPLTESQRQDAMDHHVANLASYGYDEVEWGIRGIGWLHTTHKLTLTLQLPNDPLLPGRNVVWIRETNGVQCDPSMFTIWVMVGGPEIFAGSAQPANLAENECAWYFEFDLEVPGDYIVNSKILVWNGGVDVLDEHTCISNLTALPADAYPVNEAIKGSKFYNPIKSCCEVCSRKPGCVHWTFPAGGESGDIACIMHFNDENGQHRQLEHQPSGWGGGLLQQDDQSFQPSSDDRTQRRLEWSLSEYPVQHGDPKKEPTAYFVGCGWSFWLSREHPCVGRMDDSIHGSGSVMRFDVSPPSSQDEATFNSDEGSTSLRRINDAQEEERGDHGGNRLCLPSDEFLENSRGRWVRSPFPSSTMCPLPMETDHEASAIFNVMTHDRSRPLCWHRDNLKYYGKLLTGIRVDGLWNSYLHDETRWYGKWHQYDCDYEEYTDNMLQSCVDRLGIGEVTITGASVAGHLEYYLKQRLRNIDLVEGSNRTVVLDTFQFAHKMWHYGLDDWKRELDESPPSTTEEIRYWISGFYYSSEREAHIVEPRSRQFTTIAQDILTPKGYTMLNGYDMTAAFTFDTSLQSDGLHIMGPPAKMLIVKFFHHLCSA